jgi:electron transfer flavoprotein alpha subunit
MGDEMGYTRREIMTNDVLVFAELREGQFKKINAELVSTGAAIVAKTGGLVHFAVLGSAIDGAVAEAASYPVTRVFAVDSPLLEEYSSEGFAAAMEAVVRKADPMLVLFGATAMGKDLSARLAARFDAALMTDCVSIDFEGGAVKVKRPVYSGKVYANVVTTKDGIKMASIRPNVYPPAQKGAGRAERIDIALPIGEDAIHGKVREFEGTTAGRKDVTEADVIVAGGRSLKSEENFKILEALADVLGAAVGASRAAVDAGYAPHARQIGQTGKVVNPKLYLAFGLSGAIQHLVGMRTSKVIVAVNKDANAPIFQHADYGIVGDLFEIAPLLTGEFKKLLHG